MTRFVSGSDDSECHFLVFGAIRPAEWLTFEMAGQATVTSSGIIDGSCSGLIWGTFQLENELGGWYGRITGVVEGGNMYVRLIASGVGGLEELESSWDLEGSLFSNDMSFTGRILEHLYRVSCRHEPP